MKKMLLLLLGCGLLAAQKAYAEDTAWYSTPSHFLVIMPSKMVEDFEDVGAYAGVEFPLFCGIASVYPKENKFIFTKMTNLPIRRVESRLRQVEKDGYIFIYGHPPRQESVRSRDFFLAFLLWADIERIGIEHVSNGQEVPLKAVPRFKRMCRYDSAKKPPTDCAYRYWDMVDLCIPFTEKEKRQIEKDHAK